MNNAVQTACGKAAPSAMCGRGVHFCLDETGWLSGLEALGIPNGLLQEWNEAKASSWQLPQGLWPTKKKQNKKKQKPNTKKTKNGKENLRKNLWMRGYNVHSPMILLIKFYSTPTPLPRSHGWSLIKLKSPSLLPSDPIWQWDSVILCHPEHVLALALSPRP